MRVSGYCMSAGGPELGLVASPRIRRRRPNPRPSPRPSRQAEARSRNRPNPPQKPAAKPRKPAEEPSRAEIAKASQRRPSDAYAAMPLAERLAIQSDLIWSGDYNGGVTGEFGDRAIAAVKAFQKRNKAQGNRHPHAARSARRWPPRSKPQQEQVGWQLVDDPVTGVRLGIPGKLAPQSRRAARAAAAGPRRAARCRSRPSAKTSPDTTLVGLVRAAEEKRRPTARSNTTCCGRISSSSRACRA